MQKLGSAGEVPLMGNDPEISQVMEVEFSHRNSLIK